ncbi:hypothetical protein [Ensifer aridi]|uniref:hypothetical protein n=1 Tax=Ensifer aridi TaxID=1708715 RepID=UPI001552F832|nr:hypothetical protein [Ensifer aridi]
MTNVDEFPERPLHGRRLSWEEFYRLRPDLKPANDNRAESSIAKKLDSTNG